MRAYSQSPTKPNLGRFFVRLRALCYVVLIAGTTALGAAKIDTVTVRPQDTAEALVNPMMGWTFHYYSNVPTNYGSRLAPSDTLRDWPGLSVTYLRLPWALLEPEEGRFDWSWLDTPARRFGDAGVQIALRITCSESWMRYATPEWVQDAGAKGHDFTPGKGAHEGGPFWEPDYGDPVFLAKLENFLVAFARRYDGNPHVAFIDIGSYGVWGEGHTGASTRLQVPLDVKKRHVDLHVKHFRRTLLAINDDYAGHDTRTGRAPITDYALERGVTLRDDSIMVQPPPRSWYHADLAQPFWPRLPVILEHEHFGSSKHKKAWNPDLLVKSVEEYHASYMSIHWWPREMLAENREAVRRINQRMGYRLQLREATWPKQTRLREPVEVKHTWANAGVAPCYPGGFVAFTLKDADGGIAFVHAEAGTDLRTLEVGPPGQAPTRTLTSRLTVPRTHRDGPRKFAMPLNPGTYTLWVSVGRRDGAPVIALPLKDGDGHRRYRLGAITIAPSADAEGS